MTEEFGPPIAVNGKRPEWLFGSDLCMARSKMHRTWYLAGEARPAREWGWEPIDAIRLRADHPYYQSAEYKASVGDAESRFNSVKVNYSHGGLRVAGEFRPDVGVPVFDPRPAMTEAEMIAALEATGHTVTPPDPLAEGREFIAGMLLSADWDASAEAYRAGHLDDYVRKIMAYLRANKGRL